MSGWSTEKRDKFEEAFYTFLANCFINSKNKGFVSLGENLYFGQRLFIEKALDGLEQDKHDIFCLKSRQLGLSTIARALSIFYIGVHRGLKGALVFDSASNRDEARAELETMIEDLPKKLKFPDVKKTNREGITLVNNSKVLFKHAGVKKSAASGTLGRSVGLAMSHASEICSYVDVEGLVSYRRSLSEFNPDRLYIWESTARGWGLWKDMWEDARKDEDHCTTVFLGWWTHDEQKIVRGSKDWEKYGTLAPSEIEAKKIELVKKQYDFDISQEQLAWYRRLIDPNKEREGELLDEQDIYKLQEDPWTEEEAFQKAGTIFFPGEVLTDIARNYASNKYDAYMFLPGTEFLKMKVLTAPNRKNTDLKVWQEPEADAFYEIGVDPAHGENELNDRSSIQVFRCYADGLDQVAEYASPFVNTHQLAWILATLLGWYGGQPNAQVRYALELQGPGTAVFAELKSLRNQIERGYQSLDAAERGLKNVFQNVRTYMYTRPDSMGVSSSYHIKTTRDLKIMFMERLRYFVVSGAMRIRSHALLDEMADVEREGDSIGATGSHKDDRVLAAAFTAHSWETGSRKQLMTQNRTRDAETARKRQSIVDQAGLYHQNMLKDMFAQKQRLRRQEHRVALRQNWRYR